MVKPTPVSTPAQGLGLLLRWMMVSVLFVAAAAIAVSAEAQERPHGKRGGEGGHGMMMFGGSPERMGRRIDHMLDGLNATDAQRTQVKQIANAAAADLRAQRETGKGLRERSLQIFTAPNIDAAAAESVRAQMQAQHDQASRRTLQAMLDIGKVLTPEQRAKIGERMKQRGAMMNERMERMQRERPKQ
ncbi:MAG: Spy/CpxP family protein refolding chaperone [Burkholderiales bacterium]|nr:Spy/CpxP family protein refolding chaperone [Burkholderiales bacterium]